MNGPVLVQVELEELKHLLMLARDGRDTKVKYCSNVAAMKDEAFEEKHEILVVITERLKNLVKQ